MRLPHDTPPSGDTAVRRGRHTVLVAALVGVLAVAVPTVARAQAPFPTAQAAGDAFVDALARSDPAAMARVLGQDWRRLVPVGGLDPDDKYAFLEKASQSRAVRVDGRRGLFEVGKEPFTLPIPIVQGPDGQWRFDTVAARPLIAERRIGANERSAMQAALAYLDAQREYALADRDGDGVLEYAQKLRSSTGQRDGLIWSDSLGDDSPLGPDYLPAQPGAGYHGYRFKILTAQGPGAGRARSYLIGRNMVTGFALVAWPVKWGETGVMTFIVNHQGTIYEANLGANTARIASGMTKFDPGEGWKAVKP